MTDSMLANNAVVSSNNSQIISIVPENGEQFNSGQKIIYNIEPEIGFIKQDSYLIFDILNTSSDLGRWTLQKNIGAQAIIERVDIFSKETGVLLESNTHYAQWCNIENQYLFDSVNNLQNEQGVGKPVQSWNQSVADNGAHTRARSTPSARHLENSQLSPVDNANAPAYMTRRFCVPLRCGVFRAYDNDDKAIPVMAFGGLRVEITLAAPNQALQRLSGNYKDTTKNTENKDAEVDWVAGMACSETQATQAAGTTCAVPITLAGTGGWGSTHLSKIGLVVGNSVNFTGTAYNGGAAVNYSGTISALATTTNNNLNINGKRTTTHSTLTITITGGGNGPNGINAGGIIKVTGSPNYKLMNTEFRLCQVVPDPNVADSIIKGVNYEYTGYEVFFDNIPTASLRHQIPINSVASKALAIFSQLYQTPNQDGANHSANDKFCGANPQDIALNDIVFFVNNRLYPLRSYNPQHKGDKVLNLNELVKAFRAINKQPNNLGNADFDDLEDYCNTPLICRELARKGMIFDLRNAEPEIRLGFSAARGSIVRADTFVFSKKIIQTTATGVQVIH